MQFPAVRSKVGNWKEAAYKNQWSKYTLLTHLRLLKYHSMASQPPHEPWKKKKPWTWAKEKQKWQDCGREESGRRYWAGMWYIQPLILSYHRQVCVGRKACSPFLSHIHVQVFPVRSVKWPNSILGDWLSPQVGPILTHTVLLPLLPLFPTFPSLTVVSVNLVVMSLSHLLWGTVYCP